MGIQINGQTDTITAIDGGLTIQGADLPTASVTNLNVSGVTTTATLRATSIVGVTTAGITTAYIGSVNDGPISGARNRIINGDMRIDQRNAGASVTANDGVIYTLDRWAANDNSDGSFTVQRSTVAPAGFTNSLLCTVASADTSLSNQQFAYISQIIEGFNTGDLNFGSADARTVTLSFWVRSSLTGTFGGSLRNGDANRSYPFTYSIAAANTWEYKTITIAGDTTGTWATDNSAGIGVFFGLGVGSATSGAAGAWTAANRVSATGATSVIGTNGATFYITGVQLEAGTVATPFERRSYGQELALCQRYYWKNSTGFTASGRNTTTCTISGLFPVQMRTAPTITHVANYTVFFASVNAFTATGIAIATGSDTNGFHLDSVNLSGTPGVALCGTTYPGSGLAFSAEL
jgi:hypothetical protein